jgi:hypothetical protein
MLLANHVPTAAQIMAAKKVMAFALRHPSLFRAKPPMSTAAYLWNHLWIDGAILAAACLWGFVSGLLGLPVSPVGNGAQGGSTREQIDEWLTQAGSGQRPVDHQSSKGI